MDDLEDLAQRFQLLENKVKLIEQNLRISNAPLPLNRDKTIPIYPRTFVKSAFNKASLLKDAQNLVIKDTISKIPLGLKDIRGVVTAVSVNGRTMNEIKLTWTRQYDPTYDRTEVWIKGYETNNELGTNSRNDPPFRKMAETQDSPLTFRVEATGEQILLAVRAVSKTGAGVQLKNAPSATFVLSTDPDPNEDTQTLF